MSTTFELLPAIDLRGGRVIRLRRGDFAQETTYRDAPDLVARRFAAAGAEWIHVVDLDGAQAGEPRQLELVAAIVSEVRESVRVELGGGMRTPEALAAALGVGVTRVAIGTAALRDPGFAARAVARHGADRIVASIDVREGLALGEGGREGAPGVPAVDAIARLADVDVAMFEVTAIQRDGLLAGPDLALLRSLAGLGRGRIIASGGVTTIADLLAVRAAGCAGAIVGRALYEGRLDLAEAIRALETGEDA